MVSPIELWNEIVNYHGAEPAAVKNEAGALRGELTQIVNRRNKIGTHPTGAVLSDGRYFAKRVTLSLALRSSGDAGRGFGRVGAAAALVAG
jgi:hypothetical protein